METNNLTELLTAVAAAIRERDGTDELISPQDFAERILTLSNEYVDGELKLIYGETEPGSVLGGTWVEDDFPYGTFLMAAGSGGTAGQSGGSADAVLVKHKHKFYPYASMNGIADGATLQRGYEGSSGTYIYNSDENNKNAIAEEGVDGAGKNLPPYRTVHYWRRIS